MVAVVRGGRTVAAGAVGTPQARTETPVGLGDRFHVGFGTKAVMSLLADTLVMQPAQECGMVMATNTGGAAAETALRFLDAALFSRGGQAGMTTWQGPRHAGSALARALNIWRAGLPMALGGHGLHGTMTGALQVVGIATLLGLGLGSAMWPMEAMAEPPFRFGRSSAETTLQADGTSVQLTHLEIKVATDEAARQLAQQSASYLDGVERLSLVEAATIKPDGRHLPVAPGSVRTQLAHGTPNLPAYTSRLVSTAVLPDVAAGDTLSVTWRREVLHPVMPGQFTWISTFARTMPWDDAEISISLPPGVDLQTEEFGPDHDVAQVGDRTVHRWHYASPGQTTDPTVLLAIDRVPRLFASTFPDWAALSRAYAAVLEPRMTVTPAIQAKADEIAAGAADKAGEAKRIADWVGLHVRWVAIYVDNGGYVPHAAEDVLRQGFGDCKDQVMLTSALLRARGIAADPVLISLGNTYRLPGPAVLGAFNHVITYMPQLDTYVDTTAGGSPWGTLPATEYGKPVLPVTEAGSPPGRIPVLAPGLAVQHLRTEATLALDGTVTGRTTSEATGPYAIYLRRSAGQVEAAGPDRAASNTLRSHGTPGHGTLEADPRDIVRTQYHVSGQFVLDRQSGWLEGEAFALPTGLRLLERAGEGLLGPLAMRDLPAREPTPCWSGEQYEQLSLALPEGYRPVRLPRPLKVATEAFSFESRWSFSDGVLQQDRSLVTHIDPPLCEGSLRTAAYAALQQIRRDLGTRVELEKTGE